jgi:catechol 2,3-dioxygenase-like lactoylglutathione lyase family enzyme
MIRGIHHVAVHTGNFERMVAFYRDVVGFAEVSRAEWEGDVFIDGIIGVEGSAARQIMLRAGNCYLEIVEYQRPESRNTPPLRPNDRGYTHLCLDVTNIETEFDRLTAAGMRFNRRPGDFGELKAVYGWDPDGNVIEIQETAPGHEFALGRLAAPLQN